MSGKIRLINNEMLVRDIIDLDTNFLDDDKLKKSIKEKIEKEGKVEKKRDDKERREKQRQRDICR